jgi:hypothetical protein
MAGAVDLLRRPGGVGLAGRVQGCAHDGVLRETSQIDKWGLAFRLFQSTAEISGVRVLRLNCRRIRNRAGLPWVIGKLPDRARGHFCASDRRRPYKVPGFSEVRGPW